MIYHKLVLIIKIPTKIISRTFSFLTKRKKKRKKKEKPQITNICNIQRCASQEPVCDSGGGSCLSGTSGVSLRIECWPLITPSTTFREVFWIQLYFFAHKTEFKFMQDWMIQIIFIHSSCLLLDFLYLESFQVCMKCLAQIVIRALYFSDIVFYCL